MSFVKYLFTCLLKIRFANKVVAKMRAILNDNINVFDLTLEFRTMSISTFWFFNVNFFVLLVIVMS